MSRFFSVIAIALAIVGGIARAFVEDLVVDAITPVVLSVWFLIGLGALAFAGAVNFKWRDFRMPAADLKWSIAEVSYTGAMRLQPYIEVTFTVENEGKVPKAIEGFSCDLRFGWEWTTNSLIFAVQNVPHFRVSPGRERTESVSATVMVTNAVAEVLLAQVEASEEVMWSAAYFQANVAADFIVFKRRKTAGYDVERWRGSAHTIPETALNQ